jgi:hypothetical protein
MGLIARLFTIRKRRREAKRCRTLAVSIQEFLANTPKTTSLDAFRKQLQGARSELARQGKGVAAIEQANRGGTYSSINDLSTVIGQLKSRVNNISARDSQHLQQLKTLREEAAEFITRAEPFPQLLVSIQPLQRRVNELCRQCYQARSENELQSVLKAIHREVARMERDTTAAIKAQEQLPDVLEIEKRLFSLKGRASSVSQIEVASLESTLVKGREDYQAGRYYRASAEFDAARLLHNRILIISEAEHNGAIEAIKSWLQDGKLYPTLASRYFGELESLLASKETDEFVGRWSAIRGRMHEDVMKAASDVEDIQLPYIRNRYRMRGGSKLFIEVTPLESLAAFARASVRHCRRGDKIINGV